MFRFKKHRYQTEVCEEDRLITKSAYEGRKLFKTLAFAAALGLTASAVSASVPHAAASVKAEYFTEEQTVAWFTEVSEISGLVPAESPFYLKEDEPQEKEEPQLTLEALNQIKLELCTTCISGEEAEQKVNDYIQKEKERIARINAAKISSNGGGYVRLNANGRAMSEKSAPDWLELDENGIPTNYTRCITGPATAYYSGYITATGTRPMQGTVAVNPRQIPYGTRMYITSADGRYIYGYAVAEDTGGFIYFRHGATVDLYMHSYDDCCNWGFRNVNIYILD